MPRNARFTTASDVWSYFVLMWEVWSRAQTPFRDQSLDAVKAMLDGVRRGEQQARDLLPPPNLGVVAYATYAELQERCWQVDPLKRTSFADLVEWLAQLDDAGPRSLPSSSMPSTSKHTEYSSVVAEQTSQTQYTALRPELNGSTHALTPAASTSTPAEYDLVRPVVTRTADQMQYTTTLPPAVDADTTGHNTTASSLTAAPIYHAWQLGESNIHIAACRSLRAWELADCRLTTTRLLGEGKFGAVHEGLLSLPFSADAEMHRVAIKTPKAAANGESSAFAGADTDLLKEAARMAQFNHPNIVALVGVITRTTPCKVVMQLCSRGSLLSVLRQSTLKRGAAHISNNAVLHVASDVAAGMAYLEQARFVHRDLAARNVLVNEGGACLVADFGMSREFRFNKDYYTVRGEGSHHVPIRWAAPEVVHGARYTTSSDVWSFFVVVWETWSDGARPFGSMADMMVDIKLERVRDGLGEPLGLLEMPATVAADTGARALYQGLERMCMIKDPALRTSFAALTEWINTHRSTRPQAPLPHGHVARKSRDFTATLLARIAQLEARIIVYEQEGGTRGDGTGGDPGIDAAGARRTRTVLHLSKSTKV